MVYTGGKKFGIIKFLLLFMKEVSSPLHLFDQKYNQVIL